MTNKSSLSESQRVVLDRLDALHRKYVEIAKRQHDTTDNADEKAALSAWISNIENRSN